MRKLEVLIVALSLLVPGCLLGPDFSPPSAPVANQWLEAGKPAVDASRQEYRDWWVVFKDPVLTRLIALAYQQNLDLKTAGVHVLEARAQLGVAIGEFFPQQQNVGASITYNRLPISLPYDLISNNYWVASFGAQMTWELDVWGKLRREIESADEAFLASVADYDSVLVTLTGDVATTYVNIRTFQTQIGIALDNIERQRKALQIAQARFKGGTATKRDVYQAENVLGATEASIPQFNIQLQKAKNALCVLLGIAPAPLDDLLVGSAGIPTAPEEAAIGIPADLLRRRPDVRRAELQAAAQCAQIGFAKADLLPAFSIMGNVGTLSTSVTSLGNVFRGSTLFYGVGPQVQWNILNYGQISNNVRVQDARFQELLIDYQNSVLKAQQEVENGITEFVQSRQEAVFLQQSVVAAKGALTIAMIQYSQGIVDFTTVLTAEQNLLQAQNNLAIATGDIGLGLVAAYRAMGGGWQIRENHDFVPAQTREEMAKRTNWGGLLNPVDMLRPPAPDLPAPKDASPAPRAPEW